MQITAKRPLEVGDKITGRHGNKGVVSLIIPKKRMPHFEIKGKRYYIEAILNPMSVVSRMNLGQLLETSWGWVIKQCGKDAYSTIGEPFKRQSSEELKKMLSQTGLGPDGKADLFIGEKGKKTYLIR